MITKILGSFEGVTREKAPRLFFLLVLVLLFQLFLGGAAVAPSLKFVVGLTLSLALMAWASWEGALRKLWTDNKLLSFAVLALWLVPILQIVPLPPTLWGALPGQRLEREILGYVGSSHSWRPITTDIGATQFSILTLVAPTAVLLATLVSGIEQRKLLVKVILSVAIIAAFVSFFQVATTGLAFSFYSTAHNGFGIGFFTNRNHQAIFSVIAMLLAGSLVIRGAQSRQALVVGLALISILAFSAAMAAFSRAGMAFFVVGFVCMIVAAFGGRRLNWRIALATAITITAAGAAVANTHQFERFLERLETAADDQRFEYAANSMPIIADYFPTGSGIGTFVQIYQKYETIDRLVPNYANHLHNDYLEVLMEGGILGAFALAIGLIAVGRLLFRSLRTVSTPGLLEAAAALSCAFLLLHSLVDYPLRTPALACVFAVLIVLMQSRDRRNKNSRRTIQRA